MFRSSWLRRGRQRQGDDSRPLGLRPTLFSKPSLFIVPIQSSTSVYAFAPRFASVARASRPLLVIDDLLASLRHELLWVPRHDFEGEGLVVAPPARPVAVILRDISRISANVAGGFSGSRPAARNAFLL